jgi:hypothetical protein
VSLDRDDDKPASEEDKIPRQGWLATMPKRSMSRMVILLAALAGIIYLRGRTSWIAGCMSDTFRAPAPPALPSAPFKVRVALPSRSVDASAR